MKWLFLCLAVFFMVAPAMAGEDPYISIVDNDILANSFYVSPKHLQFMFDQTALHFSVPVCFGSVPATNQFLRWPVQPPSAAGCESFFSQTPTNQPEVCDTLGTVTGPFPLRVYTDRGNPNAVTPAGNAGFYEWWIRLPKKPSGEINIVIQCGVLKPNGLTPFGYNAIEICAAEAGERIGLGTCVRQEVDPGVSPVNNTALPKLTAVAWPGPYNSFTAQGGSPSFHLTAFKNPSSYALAFDPVTGAMSNNTNSQVLDGSTSARILLKACMDKTVVAKLPVTGQINALSEIETDLEAGDIIQVRLDVPRQNSVDIYCHKQSARLAGIGED